MSVRPVAVTGLGLVTPAGVGARETWKALGEGLPAHADATAIHTGALACNRMARVDGFAIDRFSDNPQLLRLDPMIQYAVAASGEAHADAALAGVDRERVGCVMGNGNGGITSAELEVPRLLERGPRRVSPYLSISMYYAGSIGAISIELGLTGPMTLVSTSETSGADAISLAADWLRDGDADVILAGGCEAPLTRHCLAAYERLGLLAPPDADGVSRSRPYTPKARGFVMGEGAGVLALERPEHARARGAQVRAEILGSAETLLEGDPPGADALAVAVEQVLVGSGLTDVDLVVGTADALPLHDRCELEGLRRVFGDLVPPVTSARPALGHAIGAASAIDTAVAVLALDEGWAPPLWIARDGADPDNAVLAGRGLFQPFASALVLSIGVQGRVRVSALRRPAASPIHEGGSDAGS